MKILESAPSRYDAGILLLTFGALDTVYDHMASYIQSGQRVLDIGCGTGALTLRAAQRNAMVKGIDVNPEMLEIALTRARDAGLTDNIELVEMGVAELESEASGSFDVVMSGLCFSELSADELRFAMNEAARILKSRGIVLIADEVRPEKILKRILYFLVRVPLATITYALTQTTTSAISNLPEKIIEAGFEIESLNLNWLENFVEVVARKSGGK